MVEEWRLIPKSKGQYEASTLGRIRNARTKRVLAQNGKDGKSPGICLHGWMSGRRWTTIQLMGMAFLPKAKRIGHRNGNIYDNRLVNLEVLEEHYDEE